MSKNTKEHNGFVKALIFIGKVLLVIVGIAFLPITFIVFVMRDVWSKTDEENNKYDSSYDPHGG